ncbi:MAG: hypothetical protein OXI16_05080 [Chloroflexota bacterium]|nr:hypothetical protein [Chloroflexota bacterium]
MGTFRYPVEIGNPSGTHYELVNPMVDTGATYSFMPASMLERLEVEPMEKVKFTLAGEGRLDLDIGQTWIRARGKQVITIVVFGNDDSMPLLGAYALEGLRLAVDPFNRSLVPSEAFLLYCTHSG